MKRSAYLLRKAKVLQESNDEKVTKDIHIDEDDNSADVNTKHVVYRKYVKHTNYLNNAPLERSDIVMKML